MMYELIYKWRKECNWFSLKKKKNRIVCNYRGKDYADIIAIFQRSLRIKTYI